MAGFFLSNVEILNPDQATKPVMALDLLIGLRISPFLKSISS